MSDLRERQQRALVAAMMWMQRNHEQILRPWPDWIKGTKRLGEITGLARRILDLDLGQRDPMLKQHADEWLRLAWERFRHGDLFAEAITQDENWISLALTYVPFFHRGMRSLRFEECLRRLGPKIPDKNPMGFFVSLAVACSLHEMGIPCSLDIDTLTAQTWVFRIREPLRPDPARAYETTHVMMWLGDLKRIPAEVASRVGQWNLGWMDHYQKVRNGDVLAELVFMQHFFGRCVPDATWEWLLARQDPDGSFFDMDVPDRVYGRFHATVVAAMALVLCLGEL